MRPVPAAHPPGRRPGGGGPRFPAPHLAAACAGHAPSRLADVRVPNAPCVRFHTPARPCGRGTGRPGASAPPAAGNSGLAFPGAISAPAFPCAWRVAGRCLVCGRDPGRAGPGVKLGYNGTLSRFGCAQETLREESGITVPGECPCRASRRPRSAGALCRLQPRTVSPWSHAAACSRVRRPRRAAIRSPSDPARRVRR